MARFFEVLWSTPQGGLSPVCRFVSANGWFYFAVGLVLLVAPKGLLELAFAAPLPGHEPGLVHLNGMTLAIVGWFYVIGGRTGSDSFALATVVDRLLVPFVLIPLAVTGAVPPLGVLPFAILDPALAVVALVLWRRSG